MLTKKYFKIFAEELSKIKSDTLRNSIITFLLPIFEKDNDRFNQTKFIQFIQQRITEENLKRLRGNI